MRAIRLLIPVLMLSAAVAPVRAAEDAEDWALLGNMLAVVHSFVRLAAQSPDPETMRKGIDAMLSGENAEVNRAVSGILDEMTQDMPAEQRGKFVALGRDLLSLARREQARAAAQPEPASVERAIQARKDLHAMGLAYHDSRQFLDAVRRDDALAVELYVLARGVNLAARDAEGRSALDLARRSGNRQIIALLAGAGAK
ncbi:MAG: hypothetical protein ACREUO_05095 [Burkholderiales bacterium]